MAEEFAEVDTELDNDTEEGRASEMMVVYSDESVLDRVSSLLVSRLVSEARLERGEFCEGEAWGAESGSPASCPAVWETEAVVWSEDLVSADDS